MQFQELPRNFDVDLYNGLLPIQDADELVRRDGQIDRFLSRAASLFVAHGVHDHAGVALLHNHCKLESGEHMVQFEEDFAGERVLVTRPVKSAPDYRAQTPWVWGCRDGGFMPIEFTTDSKANAVFTDCLLPARFTDDYLDLIADSPVGNMFGIAILHRNLLDAAQIDQVALEQTDEEARANVLSVRDKNHGYKSIQTTWSFMRASSGETGCVDNSSCASSCRYECIVDYGKHSRVHFDHHTVQHSHGSD